MDASSQHFVGMKVRENEVIAALTNLRGEILRNVRAPITDPSPSRVVSIIAGLTDELAAAEPVRAIGIGIGGRVRSRTTVMSARFLGWQDVPLAQLVTQATGIASLVDNDVAAFTEYEHWFGAGRNDDRFAVLTLGIGTGFGLVANGGLVINDDYGIGLVSHWPLNANGPLCSAGHRGCATSVLGSDAIVRQISEALGSSVDFAGCLRLAREGQPAAARIVDDAGRGLGRLIAAICNLTLPERIIIAGEGVELAAIARETMLKSLRADRDPTAETPPIHLASGDNVEWCRGAAVLAIQAYALGTFPVTPG